MSKQEAVEKLQGIFGDMNAIGVIHSVAVELSKYIIIFLFAIYTWHCFTVFMGKDRERQEKIYHRQKVMFFVIHFVCSLVLFLNSISIQIVGLYLVQLVFFLFVSEAYPFVYEGM